MGKEKLDCIMNGRAYGSTAAMLLNSGMNANAMRPWVGDNGMPFITINNVAIPTTNALLRKDEWKQYDTAMLMAARNRLIGVQDLLSRGLTYSFANGLGKTVLEYEDASDMSDAEMNMDGLSKGSNDRIEFDLKYLPLPIIFKDFQLSLRSLSISRNGSMPLDTTQSEVSGRKVAEKLEDILFNGSSNYSFGGGTIYGYTDFPQRNTGYLSVAWDDSSATGTTIVDDVRAMKQALINDLHYGPYVIYVPTEYESVLDDDHKAESERTIRERILAIDKIEDIKVADKLTAGSVVMVEMQTETVRMVEGMPFSNLQWDTDGGLKLNFKAMTIQVPQLRADQAGRCGIAHFSER